MKKTSIILLVIASVMLLASCGGVNEFNTPRDIIGEWSGSVTSSEYTPNTYAGTYTYEEIRANTDYDYIKDYDGTINDYTYKNYNDPISNKITYTRTVADDYSYTEEVKVVTTVSQRAAVAGSTQTSGSPAWSAASKTVTRTTTVTVTQNTDGSFIESKTQKYTIVADHDYFYENDDRIGTTVSNTAQSYSTTTTSYAASEDQLSYNSNISGELIYTSIDANYDLLGNLTGYDYNSYSSSSVGSYKMLREEPAETATYTRKNEYNLVFGEDGTFTETVNQTDTYTVPEDKTVVVKNVYTGMVTGNGDGKVTLNTKKAEYTPDGGDTVTQEFNYYDTYDYYIVNKTLQIDGYPTLTFVEAEK